MTHKDTAFDKLRPRSILGVAVLVLAVGTVFYKFVEDLSWINSLYFCVITLTTIGYGDITPTTELGRVFTIFYVLVGITLLGASLNYLMRRRLAIHKEKQNDKDK